MNNRTLFSFLALVALGLAAAHPATAQTTIYSFQADNGYPNDYTGAGAAGDANFVRSYYAGEADGFFTYNRTVDNATFFYQGNGGFHQSVSDGNSVNALLYNWNDVQGTNIGKSR